MFYGGFFQMLRKGLRGHKRFSDSDEFQDVNMLKKYCKAGNFIMEVFYACNFHLFLQLKLAKVVGYERIKVALHLI